MFLQNQVGYTIIQRDRMPGEGWFSYCGTGYLQKPAQYWKKNGVLLNYEEARAYLDDAARYGSVLGLDTMKELLARLGNPQDDLKFIHIGGTNGKRIGTFLSFCRSERSRLSRWTIYFADAVFLPGTYTGKMKYI